MRTRALLLRGLVGAALSIRIGAGTGGEPSSPAVDAGGDPASLAGAVDRLIGAAGCARSEECRVIGVGARACGGPEGFRAWSVADTDPAALEVAVLRQADARRAELDRLGERSTCDVMPQPSATCRIDAGAAKGRCVLLKGNRAD